MPTIPTLRYRVYGNDMAGGPIDYSTILATTTSLTWDSPILPAGADASFLVRTYDTGTGYEDENVDARVRIRLDSAGNDLTVLPNAPTGLTAIARAGGTVDVSWVYNPGGQGSSPTGFHLYLGAGSVDYASVAGVYPYERGSIGRNYTLRLSGLSDGTTYLIGVRSFNTSGEEPNTATVSVVGSTTGPDSVSTLTATVVN